MRINIKPIIGISFFFIFQDIVFSKSFPESIRGSSYNSNSSLRLETNNQNLNTLELPFDEKEKVFDLENNNIKFSSPAYLRSFFKILIANLEDDLSTNNLNSNQIEILADNQKIDEPIISAEGNVIVRSNNAVLKSDNFSYDKEKKLLIIKGNIKFKSENEFITASDIKYDFKNKKGYILNAYGSIRFDSLPGIQKNNEKNFFISDDFDKSYQIKEVKLNSSSRLEMGNLQKENALKTDIKPVVKSRFSSERIDINDDIWKAKKLFITNDPFNDPQLVVKNKNFLLKIDDDVTKIRSEWSYLIFENKLSVPIGPRRINVNEDNSFKYGAGYDNKEYDGLYIFRNFDPISFDNSGDSVLNIRSNFHIQRALKGKTNSFPDKSKSSTSQNEEQPAKGLDYLGLDLNFRTPINKWNYYLDIYTNSLDFEKIDKIVKSKTLLTKNLYTNELINSKEVRDLSFFGNFREKTKNGSLGEILVQSSVGGRFDLQKDETIMNSKKRINHKKISVFSVTYGRYESPSRITSNDFITRDRLNLSLKRIYNFHIWEPKKINFIDASYRYTPESIQKGFYWFLEGNIDSFRYSDNNKQDLFLIKSGPRLVLGEFKKDILDYTELSIYPRFKFDSGKSPFSFDQVVDNKAIELLAKQQIYGPLILKFSGVLSLDKTTSGNDNLINPVINLSLNRRAYEFGIFYNLDTEVGGLNFKIHNFNFEGLGKKFK